MALLQAPVMVCSVLALTVRSFIPTCGQMKASFSPQDIFSLYPAFARKRVAFSGLFYQGQCCPAFVYFRVHAQRAL